MSQVAPQGQEEVDQILSGGLSWQGLRKDLGYTCMGLVIQAFASLWLGVIASYLWSWFFVPFGLQSIGVMHAAGVCMAVALVTYQFSTAMVGHFKTYLSGLLLRPTGALIIGWVFHFFM